MRIAGGPPWIPGWMDCAVGGEKTHPINEQPAGGGAGRGTTATIESHNEDQTNGDRRKDDTSAKVARVVRTALPSNAEIDRQRAKAPGRSGATNPQAAPTAREKAEKPPAFARA